MEGQNKKIKEKYENVEVSQKQSIIVEGSTTNLDEITRREEQYRALVDFFKKDIEIKTDLINLSPESIDEYSEDSRMNYLDKLFTELKNMEFKFKEIAKNLNMGLQSENSLNTYFERATDTLSKLAYGYNRESLQEIYQKVFTDMKPELLERTKQTFRGYTMQGGLKAIPSIINDVDSINELLHIVHSSIINDEELLQSMPILETKKNTLGYDIILYGEANEVSKEIFENFPIDLDVGYTDIVSMKDRALMMVRDRGYALTIDIDSSNKGTIDVRYFIPKICNLDMVKALPGINTSSITQNGASGFFVSKEQNISETIFNFIDSVPTDMDIPKSETLTFSIDDAKSLATGRKLSNIKELFSEFKQFIKSKSNVQKLKGEDKENYDQSR